MQEKSAKNSALKSTKKSSGTFKSTQNSAQKSSFPQKSAQKALLKRFWQGGTYMMYIV